MWDVDQEIPKDFPNNDGIFYNPNDNCYATKEDVGIGTIL